ncbi:MAG: NfeD family protein [Calditrichia bacterium]
MKHKLNIFFAALMFWAGTAAAQVYHIEISGTIDLGLPPYIERVIEDAKAADAKAIVLEVNTFGGRVDAATQIKDILLNTDLPTIAYVNKRAISAGALISLSCTKIGMTPGSSIGAATVVNQQGEKGSEKQISYFRAEMGATAERNGRNRMIAEGMVDEDVVVEGLSEKGKLITLTADDAIKWKIADAITPTLEAFLDSLGYGEEEIVYNSVNWAEELVRFFTGPVISSLLISLGLLGLFIEIKSPGWGLPGTLGLLCLGLFFGSQYIISLASAVEIILFFAGVALLLVEIFILPGFGVAGIAGVLALVAGIYLSLIGSFETVTFSDFSNAAYRIFGSLTLTMVAAVIVARFLPNTSIWRKISLGDEQKRESGYVVNKDYSRHVGKTGVTVTPLRPSGIGQFSGERLDVVSEGGFIEINTPIKIVHIDGYRLIVREQKTGKEITEDS